MCPRKKDYESKKVISTKQQSRPCNSLPGLATPRFQSCLTEKKHLLLQRENRSLPGWAIVLTNALRIIVVTTLENLLLSSGKADLLLAKKHRNSLGFSTVANLIDNFLNVLNSSKITTYLRQFKGKRRRK